MECIKENLKFTRLEKKGITLTKDVLVRLISFFFDERKAKFPDIREISIQ